LFIDKVHFTFEPPIRSTRL